MLRQLKKRFVDVHTLHLKEQIALAQFTDKK